MKTFVLFFLLLLVSISIQAQDSIQPTPKKSTLHFGYSAQSTYRKLRGDASLNNQIQALDTLEEKKFGQTFSVLYERKLVSQLRLQTGLRFSQYGEQTKTYLQTNAINFRNVNNRLAVPLFLCFVTNETKKVSFSISGGLEMGYLLSTKASYTNPSGSAETISPSASTLKLITFSAEINAGIRVPLTETWQFVALLNHVRFIQSSIIGPLKKLPYATGLHIGLSRSL